MTTLLRIKPFFLPRRRNQVHTSKPDLSERIDERGHDVIRSLLAREAFEMPLQHLAPDPYTVNVGPAVDLSDGVLLLADNGIA